HALLEGFQKYWKLMLQNHAYINYLTLICKAEFMNWLRF
ncbi:MAG: hypothetical protein ACI8X3_003609, partial [Saprospiraceae bacterium]